MEQLGIIWSSRSEWTSPIVVIKETQWFSSPMLTIVASPVFLSFMCIQCDGSKTYSTA